MKYAGPYRIPWLEASIERIESGGGTMMTPFRVALLAIQSNWRDYSECHSIKKPPIWKFWARRTFKLVVESNKSMIIADLVKDREDGKQ